MANLGHDWPHKKNESLRDLYGVGGNAGGGGVCSCEFMQTHPPPTKANWQVACNGKAHVET
jgi:hypothetical protein